MNAKKVTSTRLALLTPDGDREIGDFLAKANRRGSWKRVEEAKSLETELDVSRFDRTSNTNKKWRLMEDSYILIYQEEAV